MSKELPDHIELSSGMPLRRAVERHGTTVEGKEQLEIYTHIGISYIN
jgi:hypothetical protein